MEIPHIYKICFISQSGYLLFRSCPGFSGDLITKSCTLWQNILKTERQISGMIPSPSAPPPSYNQVELWSRLESSSSTCPPQQVLKDISFSKLPPTLSIFYPMCPHPQISTYGLCQLGPAQPRSEDAALRRAEASHNQREGSLSVQPVLSEERQQKDFVVCSKFFTIVSIISFVVIFTGLVHANVERGDWDSRSIGLWYSFLVIGSLASIYCYRYCYRGESVKVNLLIWFDLIFGHGH